MVHDRDVQDLDVHDREASSAPHDIKPARAASRRDLLKGLSVAGLAAGTTSVAVVPAQADQPADSTALQFEETDHVRTYYDLARR